MFNIVEDDDEEPDEVGQWDPNARRIRFHPGHRAADPSLATAGGAGASDAQDEEEEMLDEEELALEEEARARIAAAEEEQQEQQVESDADNAAAADGGDGSDGEEGEEEAASTDSQRGAAVGIKTTRSGGRGRSRGGNGKANGSRGGRGGSRNGAAAGGRDLSPRSAAEYHELHRSQSASEQRQHSALAELRAGNTPSEHTLARSRQAWTGSVRSDTQSQFTHEPHERPYPLACASLVYRAG